MSPRRPATLVLSAVAGLAAFAPSASAGLLVASASSCDQQTLEQPFAPWYDVASYVLAPGGTLETGTAGWATSGGAAVADGNESFNVHGAGESKSLSLPPGSSATSGSMCVGLEHPTVRFFVKRNGGTPLSTLAVEALVEGTSGDVYSVPVGSVGAGSSWTPTAPMVLSASLLPLLPGDHTPVSFRLTPQGSAGWSVDDVYVDPYGSH